jgi:hypothetical protein
VTLFSLPSLHLLLSWQIELEVMWYDHDWVPKLTVWFYRFKSHLGILLKWDELLSSTVTLNLPSGSNILSPFTTYTM